MDLTTLVEEETEERLPLTDRQREILSRITKPQLLEDAYEGLCPFNQYE